MGQTSTLSTVDTLDVGPESSSGRDVDWRRWTPRLLVSAAVLCNLVALRSTVWAVEFTDDTAFHAALTRWVTHRVEHGHLPLDGWFPFMSLGAPEVRLYQSLPHLLTGLVGSVVGVDWSVRWILYLGVALWPVAVYWSARLFGFDRGSAAAAALVSPLIASKPGFGYEWDSYTWVGWGLWSQLWGMWLLPFALALSWRAVSRGRGYAIAALLVAATIAVHFLTGYFALLALGLWVVITPREFLVRLGRAALVGIGAVAASAWVIVPLLPDLRDLPSSNLVRAPRSTDSVGAAKALGWLVSGEIFDVDRLPVVTLLVAVGIGVCAWRFTRSERSRAVVAVFVLAMVLFFGRTTWGAAVRVLPLSSDLLFRRFVAPMHLGGIWLAGVGAAWLARTGMRSWSRARAGEGPRFVQTMAVSPLITVAVAVAAVAVVLAPAIRERVSYVAHLQDYASPQRTVEHEKLGDVLALARIATARGDGRVWAGNGRGWSTVPLVGFVKGHTILENHDVDHIGTKHVNSLMLDPELRFDERNPAQYDLFNVRYLLLPDSHEPRVPATELARRGHVTLWEVPTSGYLDVVDTVGPPIVADGSNLRRRSADFVGSPQLEAKHFPTVAFDGDTAAKPSATSSVSGSAGRVVRQAADLDDGRFRGTVEADRPAVVLLKATYNPRWRATVDGKPVSVQMVAPALVGVPVSAGTHRVEFHYQPVSGLTYAGLFAIGVLALVALAVIPRWWARRRVTR